MKKTIVAIAACLLLFTQCRKKVEQIIGITPQGETIDVALDASTGDDKTTIDGYTVSWVAGDKIYVVGQEDGYLGYMAAQSSGSAVKFKGTIKKTAAAQNYYFYYVGDNDFAVTGDDTFTFSVANQYGILSGNANSIANKLMLLKGSLYLSGTPGGELGHVTMNSMLSMIRLNLKEDGTSMSSGTVTVYGSYSSVKINGKTGCYASSNPLTTGNITLNNASGDYYMAIIPGNQSENGTEQAIKFVSYYGKSLLLIATVAPNKFYNKDSSKSVNMMDYLKKDFSISQTDKVWFSKGNLQYLGKAAEGSKWRFAHNQWDAMGSGPTGTGNVDLGPAYSGLYNTGSGIAGPGETDFDRQCARDLFGWGATGYQDTHSDAHNYQINYQPYSTSRETVNSTYNQYGYGPDYIGTIGYDLTVGAKSDWGFLFNTSQENISNMGWRVLKTSEFYYMLKTRKVNVTHTTGTAGEMLPYGEGVVHGMKGLIIFPDDWDGSAYEWFTYGNSAYANVFDETPGKEWLPVEIAGAVFLPSAGHRDGTSANGGNSNGYYWLSNHSSSYYAASLTMSSGDVSNKVNSRLYGFSVRLIRAIDSSSAANGIEAGDFGEGGGL